MNKRLQKQNETQEHDSQLVLKFLREDAERGFRYVHAISRRLVEYEQNRTTYPNFSHFYPRIVETFDELDRPKRPRPPVDEKTRPERD